MDDSHVSRLHDSESDSIDRLSKLPDSLILIILSLLQMRDVVRTTILSKRWKNLWTTVPCLDFWQHRSDHLQEFRRFIYAALAQWEGPKMLKFTINFTYFFRAFINDVDSWLLFAIEKQVEELSLHFANYRQEDSEYCLPQRLYSCSSITKLSFSYLKLKIEENVQWDRLKSLKIVGLNSLSADAMNRLLSGAPRLEDLVFCNSSMFENFNIRSTSLKTLSIQVWEMYADSELRIWAPNLLNFKIHAQLHGMYFLDVPSLTNAVLRFDNCLFGIDYWGFKRIEMFNQVFQSVRHVENVTLSSLCIKFLLYMKKKDRVVQFSNAKFLNLCSDSDARHDVLEMFPNLMMLINNDDDKGHYSFEPKTTPSLRDLIELL